ncbi:MAG: YHS domain-containing protein [Phycisphaerae bacterium]|nr:YHS domain-containing protein [Phycisphaerae bacterium]MCZ2399244.1 YHS domain-containing protein [Phycisphaerae bacterium]
MFSAHNPSRLRRTIASCRRPGQPVARRRGPTALRVALLGAIATVAAAQDTASAPAPINALCPVMTEEKVDPAFTTTYRGRVIGFCCDKCLAKFEANPQRYASRLTALLASTQPTSAPSITGQQAPESRPGDPERSADRKHTESHDADTESQQHETGGHVHGAEGGAENDGHKHEHEHGEAVGFFARLVAWLGKFHPPAVNFPIAMIAGAALAELLLIATGRSFFANAARFCLWVGCLGAVAAAMLGWFFGGLHLVDDSWVLTTHRWLGTSTALWSVLVLVLGERAIRRGEASRRTFRVVLFSGAGLVAVTGFFGGSLIYGLNHYAW